MILQALFFLLAFVTLASALAVVILPNPVFSALSLAICMLAMAGLFFTLEAYFLAGVQIILYAGAVVVMFVMVLMIFDLREEKKAFVRGTFSTLLKLASGALFLSTLVVAILASIPTSPLAETNTHAMIAAKGLALMLFTKYVFVFEVVGILLLVVLVGAIVIAKGKGGSHA